MKVASINESRESRVYKITPWDLRRPRLESAARLTEALSRLRRVFYSSLAFRKRLKKFCLHNITPYGVMCAVKQLDNVLIAISHPSRRAIIGQLARGPARFTDIARPFDTALNAVTKHLKLLERAGLIERKKQGREVFISFRGEPLRQVAGWVHQYERFWNERLDQFQKYFEDKKEKKENKQ